MSVRTARTYTFEWVVIMCANVTSYFCLTCVEKIKKIYAFLEQYAPTAVDTFCVTRPARPYLRTALLYYTRTQRRIREEGAKRG